MPGPNRPGAYNPKTLNGIQNTVRITGLDNLPGRKTKKANTKNRKGKR